MDRLCIYGAYGYTGSLIAREAVARGGSPVLAGRDRVRLSELATELGLEYQVFDLEAPPETVASHLEPYDAVCHCAGPFVHTAVPMAKACLNAETDYLDITGEFRVFDRLAGMDEAANAAACTLLPGVGFDVVPTDCLARFLADRHPAPDELALAIATTSSLSRGTAKTLLEGLGGERVFRRGGQLVSVPDGQTREIDFGPDVGTKPAVLLPWGDVVTAPHSTGIDTVRVYAGTSRRAIRTLSLARPLERLAGTPPVKRGLEWAVDRFVDGPDGRELAHGRAVIWGEVSGDGEAVRGRLTTPNPYALTVDTAVSAAQRTLAGTAPSGFQTPASAFGADFVLECADVQRILLRDSSPVRS